jgi:hypothetical protein
VQYGTSSSNIALSQNQSVQVIHPLLEVETADGQWDRLDVDLGIPAGKTKTILCDLKGKLPPGSKRLRLTTTYEIRWDRIALAEAWDLDASCIHELDFTQADLAWRGFSEMRTRHDGHPTTPDFDTVHDLPPWRTAVEGWYTRYGDVQPLLSRADGKLALLNGGDVVTLHAPASALPPVPRGMVRAFLLESVGWNKEGDSNTVGGQYVLPLPHDVRADAGGPAHADQRSDWRLRYNTRWVAGDHFGPAGREQDGP